MLLLRPARLRPGDRTRTPAGAAARSSDLVLHRVERPGLARYPNASGTLLVLHSDDRDADVRRLRAADVRRLRAAGVVFLQLQPVHAPAGRSIGFLDPSGNVHELLQPPSA